MALGVGLHITHLHWKLPMVGLKSICVPPLMFGLLFTLGVPLTLRLASFPAGTYLCNRLRIVGDVKKTSGMKKFHEILRNGMRRAVRLALR